MAATVSARRRAPAKINLYLDVLGRRDDGYHDLETLFLALPWGDAVEVTQRDTGPAIDLAVHGIDGVPAGERNLAWQAAARFREAAGVTQPLHIALTKRIPPGAGLGGGSSDAAAVLQCLTEMYPGRLDDAALYVIAAALGADVPFFLVGDAAIGRGRGDELEPVALARPTLVLILPPFGCDTAAVFGAFERGRRAPPGGLPAMREALASRDPAAIRAAHYNALAFAAMKTHPAFLRFTSDVERRLGRAPAMSGSGSTLFDLPDEGAAAGVLDALADLPGTRVVLQA